VICVLYGVEAEVARATAIRPARRAFKFGDDLHRANLRRAAHRNRRETSGASGRAWQSILVVFDSVIW